MKVGFAQIDTTVGDLDGNASKIAAAYRRAVAAGADLVLTPELALPGYPPRDLLFKSRFVPRTLETLDRLRAEIGPVPLIVGFVDVNRESGAPFRNAAAILQGGTVVHTVHKSLLPAYDVFDEERYFEPAQKVAPVAIAGRRLGVTICEDMWTEDYLPRRLYAVDPVAELVAQGADLLINISASPFALGKPERRKNMLSGLARRHGVPICYCNLVGGNDHLIFDGHSLVFDPAGLCLAQLPGFEEAVEVIDLAAPPLPIGPPPFAEPAHIFHALVLGLRDYLVKCGFQRVVLGLSGGIDSAVTAVIAAHAAGPANVLGVALPTQFSSEGSITDARALAANLGIGFEVVSIQPAFEAIQRQLAPLFRGRPADVTEENLQPRLRAAILMAISNKFGHLVLTTGNKSELAVGYCTIYGDMAGGLAVISDVPKTKIYELARWINRDSVVIPPAILTKPPSAELRPGQTDQDTLPPYPTLDAVLELYVEQNLGVDEIVARGFDEATVRWVARRVDLNEWKREQAAPGLKITSRAFGIGRRMPIAQRFIE